MADRRATPGPSQFLLELTGLRFFSALVIGLYHFRDDYWLLGGDRIGRWATSWAALAMPIFFSLSGLSASLMFGADAARIEKRRFWWGRFTRIYPTYLFVTLLLAPPAIRRIVELSPSGGELAAIVEHSAMVLFLLHSFGGPEHVYLWNTPSWTLSVDMVLYALFPWMAAWLWPRVRDARSAVIASVALFAILLATPIAWEVLEPDGASPVRHGRVQAFWLSYLKCSVFAWWPAFALGLVLGKVYVLGIGREHATRFIVTGLASAAAILWLRPVPDMVLHVGGLMPAAMLIVLGVAYAPPWTRFLSARPLLALGQASFPFYLLHFEGYFRLKRLLQVAGLEGRVPKALFGAVAVVVLWIAALLVHRLVERPARAFLRRRVED